MLIAELQRAVKGTIKRIYVAYNIEFRLQAVLSLVINVTTFTLTQTLTAAVFSVRVFSKLIRSFALAT